MIPMAFDTDQEACAAALSSIGVEDPRRARIAWITNTLHLSPLLVSLAILEQLAEKPERAVHVTFDAAGMLLPGRCAEAF